MPPVPETKLTKLADVPDARLAQLLAGAQCEDHCFVRDAVDDMLDTRALGELLSERKRRHLRGRALGAAAQALGLLRARVLAAAAAGAVRRCRWGQSLGDGRAAFLRLARGALRAQKGAEHARSAPSVQSHGFNWQPSQHARMSLRAEGATEPREGRLGTCGAAHLRSRCPSGLRSGRCGRSSSGRRRVSLTGGLAA